MRQALAYRCRRKKKRNNLITKWKNLKAHSKHKKHLSLYIKKRKRNMKVIIMIILRQ